MSSDWGFQSCHIHTGSSEQFSQGSDHLEPFSFSESPNKYTSSFTFLSFSLNDCMYLGMVLCITCFLSPFIILWLLGFMFGGFFGVFWCVFCCVWFCCYYYYLLFLFWLCPPLTCPLFKWKVWKFCKPLPTKSVLGT